MKVIIAVPSYADWKAPMGISMTLMAACAAKRGIDIGIISHGGTQIAKVRNDLVRMAQQAKGDWLLFIDDDMTFPMDALQRLLAHDKDIVGVAACGRVPPYPVYAMLAQPASSGLVPAHRLGMGLMLVRMSVFDHLPSPWFVFAYGVDQTTANPDGEIGEDYYFCRAAERAGIQPYCDLDLSVKIGHIGDMVFHVTPDQLNGGYGSAAPLSAIPTWKVTK